MDYKYVSVTFCPQSRLQIFKNHTRKNGVVRLKFKPQGLPVHVFKSELHVTIQQVNEPEYSNVCRPTPSLPDALYAAYPIAPE